MKNNLYLSTGVFQDYFKFPQIYFDECIIAEASHKNQPVAICLVTMSFRDNYYSIGFYTKSPYRKKGFARRLGVLATDTLKNIYPNHPELYAEKSKIWGTAYHICEKYTMGLNILVM